MSDDEDALLARARQGDPAAFAALVRRYQQRVYAAALHLTGNHSDADDVTQDAFIRAFRGLRSFDGRASFFTWMYRIAINTGLNRLRSHRRSAALTSSGEAEVGQLGGRPEALGEPRLLPDEQVRLTQEVRSVLVEVARLSLHLRVTLVLATMEGLPYRQIAEILNVPEGTVAWRVNEARRILRLRLAEAASSGAQKKTGTDADP